MADKQESNQIVAEIGVDAGQASLSDLSDKDVVINYCLQNKVEKGAIDELLKRGYTSLEALRLVEVEDLVSPKIPKGQRRLIITIADALKTGTASTATPQPEVSTAVVTTSASTSLPQAAVPTFTQAPAMSGQSGEGTIDTTYNSIVQNLQVQQRQLIDNNAQGTERQFRTAGPQISQASWSDPHIHISAAAGGKSVSHLDICDFVQSNIAEEVVLGGQGEQQIIVKAGPKKPRLENLTLCQWSVANLAILYKLCNDQQLVGPALMDYLSYTTKIYQLVQRYSLVSVLLYDREYRKLQASMKFRWGTEVQHLTNVHLQPRDRPVAQGSQPSKKGQSQLGQKQTKLEKGKADNVVCKNYNSQKGCSYQQCKFKHSCILPGCYQKHSAITHIAEKN